MPQIAVILLADVDSPEGIGRMANAFTTVNEAREAGDGARLVLDGAGTKWIPALRVEDHKYHGLFAEVRDSASACLYCARAYGVKDEVDASGIPFADDFRGHPSIRQLIVDGYAVVTFEALSGGSSDRSGSAPRIAAGTRAPASANRIARPRDSSIRLRGSERTALRSTERCSAP